MVTVDSDVLQRVSFTFFATSQNFDTYHLKLFHLLIKFIMYA